MLVRDIVRVRKIQPVIQLGHAGDIHEAGRSFVWTSENRKMLQDFAQRLAQGQGGGIFIKGHYGTGKSHMLAFLAAQCENWPALSQVSGIAIGKKHLAIPVSLVHWQSDMPLAEIVLRGLEASPASSTANLQERFSKILQDIQARGYAGIIILLDELSEFLKSKPTPGLLAEDVRTLQFLAEFCRGQSSWVVGALQEDIEGIGNTSRETSLKLKDRFFLRWNLSIQHMEDIISGRLLEHVPENEARLLELYKKNCATWPEVFKSPETFTRTYPLHPLTLDLLEGLGRLFSEHRGALHFLREVLETGSAGNAPFLAQPASELIGPEHIYDVFASRFSENPELREYHNPAMTHLLARIEQLLRPQDHALARACMKMIVLCTIDPRREGATVTEISAAVHLAIGGSARAGEEYIKEKILGPLKTKANYLLEKDGRFVVDPGHRSFEQLNRAIERRSEQWLAGSPALWHSLLALLDRPPLNLSHFHREPSALGPVAWLNTLRPLRLSFDPEAKAVELVLLLPCHVSTKKLDGILYWQAREPAAGEYAELLRAAAILQILGEEGGTIVEKQLHGEAQKANKAERTHWRTILEGLFCNGSWSLGNEPLVLNLAWKQFHTLEDALEDGAYELFSRRYPLFRQVAPRVPFINERMLNDIIENLVRQGEASESELRKGHVLEAALGVLKPAGLLVQDKSHWRMSWDATVSPLVETIEQSLQQNNGKLQAVRRELCEGEYGLTPMLFNFYIWCSIVCGHMKAMRQGEDLPEGRLSFYNLETIDELRPQDALSPDEWQALAHSGFFQGVESGSLGLAQQRKWWQYLQSQVQSLSRWHKKWQDAQWPNPWGVFSQRLSHCLRQAKLLVESCQSQSVDSTTGLRHFQACTTANSLSWPDISWAMALTRCFEESQVLVDQRYSYLNDEFLQELSQDWNGQTMQSMRRDMLAWDETWALDDDPAGLISAWLIRCQDWIEQYQKVYQVSHGSPGSTEEAGFLALLANHGWLDANHVNICQRNPLQDLVSRPFCRCGHRPSLVKVPDSNLNLHKHFLEKLKCSDFELDLQRRLAEAMVAQQWKEAAALFLDGISVVLPAERVRTVNLVGLSQRWKDREFTREGLSREVAGWFGQNVDKVKFADGVGDAV